MEKMWVNEDLFHDKRFNQVTLSRDEISFDSHIPVRVIPESEWEEREWISVESKPKPYQDVLFYGKGHDPLVGKTRGETCIGYYRDGFRFDGKDSVEVAGVTHWMPKPNPPEEESR